MIQHYSTIFSWSKAKRDLHRSRLLTNSYIIDTQVHSIVQTCSHYAMFQKLVPYDMLA